MCWELQHPQSSRWVPAQRHTELLSLDPRLWAEPRAGSGADPAEICGCSCSGSAPWDGWWHQPTKCRAAQGGDRNLLEPPQPPACPAAAPSPFPTTPQQPRDQLLSCRHFCKLWKGTRAPSLHPVARRWVTSGRFSLQEEGESQRSLPGPTAARPSPQRRGCPRASGRPPSPRCIRRVTATGGHPSPTASGRTGRHPQVGLGVGDVSPKRLCHPHKGGPHPGADSASSSSSPCRFDAVSLQPAHHAAPQRGGDTGPRHPPATGDPRQPAPRLGRGAQAPALLPVRNPFGQRVKGARGREMATKPRARGASGTPRASTQRPGPAGSHVRRRRSRAILFVSFPFFFFVFFPFPSQPASLG